MWYLSFWWCSVFILRPLVMWPWVIWHLRSYRSFGETRYLLEDRCSKFLSSQVSKLFIRCPALFMFTCPHVCWCPGASALQLRPFQLVDAWRLPLHLCSINRLTPNDPYMRRTAPLTSKRCILYIYSTNISTGYFKHALCSPFLSLQNAVCFIMLTCLVPVLFTFFIQGVLKLKKKIIPAPNG